MTQRVADRCISMPSNSERSPLPAPGSQAATTVGLTRGPNQPRHTRTQVRSIPPSETIFECPALPFSTAVNTQEVDRMTDHPAGPLVPFRPCLSWAANPVGPVKVTTMDISPWSGGPGGFSIDHSRPSPSPSPSPNRTRSDALGRAARSGHAERRTRGCHCGRHD